MLGSSKYYVHTYTYFNHRHHIISLITKTLLSAHMKVLYYHKFPLSHVNLGVLIDGIIVRAVCVHTLFVPLMEMCGVVTSLLTFPMSPSSTAVSNCSVRDRGSC